MFVVAPGEQQGPTAVAEALKRKSLGDLMADAQKQAAHGRAPGPPAAVPGREQTRCHQRALGPRPRGRIRRARQLQRHQQGGRRPAAGDASGGAGGDRGGHESGGGDGHHQPTGRWRPSLSFSADRPFAVAIVHRPTGAILFAGYIADPGDDPGPAPAEPKAVR